MIARVCQSQVDGIIFSTFAESARALGLLEDTSEAEYCMNEAIAGLCTPYELRTLFVILVSEGAPASILYEQHWPYMSKDMKLNRNLSEELAKNELLCDLQSRFERQWKTSDFRIP